MKLGIILGLVAFVVTATAATLVIVGRAPPPVVAEAAGGKPVGADSAARDTAHVRPARGHVATRDSARRDSATAKTDSVPPAGSPPTAPPKPVVASAAPPRPPAPSGPSPAERAGAYKQVARVFSSMKAPEAAQVLALMSDDEVEGILRAVGPRQAADFLTNFPKPRAAALSRRLLVPKPKEPTR